MLQPSVRLSSSAAGDICSRPATPAVASDSKIMLERSPGAGLLQLVLAGLATAVVLYQHLCCDQEVEALPLGSIRHTLLTTVLV